MYEIIYKLIKIPRPLKQLIMILIDYMLVVIAILGSIALSLGDLYWPEDGLFWATIFSPALIIIIFYSAGLYHSVTRYTGLKTVLEILKAVTLFSIVGGIASYFGMLQSASISVVIINLMFLFMLIVGSRFFARWLIDFFTNSKSNIVIYGAGQSGINLSNIFQQSEEYNLIAYIDGNIHEIGNYVNTIKVYPPDSLSLLINKYNIKEVFVNLPMFSRKEINKVILDLSAFPVIVKSMPNISHLVDGKLNINELLEIDISDLLGRDSIYPDKKLMKVNISGKNVLITGAGGSIGSELSAQILALKPKKLVLFDISEHALYLIEKKLLKLNILDIEIFPIIGSVTSDERVKDVISHFDIQTIYHAAAYKHVPLVEFNQSEGVFNNTIGTLIAAKAAISLGVETFVLISTDKAVRPTNTMGASKRLSELILQALAKEKHSTCFTMVRFGNVLNSSGSVIPLFKKQIREGGPVTVTDSNIVRYFMTVPEAVELVIQSGALASGGDVFVLDMGDPVNINDLAIKMIHLSGLQVMDSDNPNGDIKIEYTGLRPGEKLYEELLVGTNVNKTRHPKIMRAEEEMIDWSELEPILKDLKDAAINADHKKIRELLIILIPEFNPQSPIVDFLFKTD